MARSIAWGIIVIAIGAWTWISSLNPDLLPGPVFHRDWPLIIVIVGFMSIIEGIAHVAKRRK